MKVEIRQHAFELLPQRAVYWESASTLLIADPHFGKITHFRKAGIALPAVSLDDNFQRLTSLLESRPVERLIILGDIFHSDYNAEWEKWVAWTKQFSSLDIIKVAGNHDRFMIGHMKAAGYSVTDFFEESGFVFAHHPSEKPDTTGFTFCGHVHPVFVLTQGYHQRLKLPCFVVDEHQMILPGFGVFLGGFAVPRMVGRQIFISTSEEIVKV